MTSCLSSVISLYARRDAQMGSLADSGRRAAGRHDHAGHLWRAGFVPPNSASRFPPTPKSSGEATDCAWSAPGRLNLSHRFGNGDPTEFTFTAGARRVRVLTVSTSQAERTWFVEAGGQTYVVCGPAYVGESRVSAEEPAPDDRASLVRSAVTLPERRQRRAEPGSAGSGGGSSRPTDPGLWPVGPPARFGVSGAAAGHPRSLTLSAWEVKDASQPASPDLR